MSGDAIFEADGTTIDLGRITSFENADPAAATGTPTQALNSGVAA